MNWNYEKAVEKGPISLFFKIFGAVIVIGIVISAVGYGLGWFGEAAQVAQKEFGPQAALQKYEWFIDQSNAIAKMDQDIALYEKRVKDIDERYKKYGEVAKWPINITTTYNHETETAKTDLLAVVSQRNNLVKEYNAASDKFNWSLFRTKPDKPKEKFQEYSSN